MGLVDAFTKEDRVEVKYSDFYALVRAGAERDIIANGIKNKIPHKYIAQMIGEEHNEADWENR